MNKYAGIAKKHWQTHLPGQTRALENPDEFFEEIGSQISETVQARAVAIAGSDSPDESYMEKVARLSTAQLIAESDTLREMLPPSPEDSEADQPTPEAQASWDREQIEREAWQEAQDCFLATEAETEALYEQRLKLKLTEAGL